MKRRDWEQKRLKKIVLKEMQWENVVFSSG
jgi:hypothetical protein